MNKDSISELPRARKENLIVKEVDGETLVYDVANDKAHCLNQTAARIWQYCDGNRSISEISGLLSTPGNTPVTDEVVLLALDQLQKIELLESNNERAFQLAGMNRRELPRHVLPHDRACQQYERKSNPEDESKTRSSRQAGHAHVLYQIRDHAGEQPAIASPWCPDLLISPERCSLNRKATDRSA